MAELNHNTIKTKIVAILKANTSLYTTTAEANKLRSIEVGYPQGSSLSDSMPPYAYVTNSNPFESITNRGSVVSNGVKMLEHSFQYDIVFVVNESDSRTSELRLDNLQKTILDTLEADVDLTGTGSAEVDNSFPIRVDDLRVERSDKGMGFNGRVITLKLIKVSN
jgi:hypothetical protein